MKTFLQITFVVLVLGAALVTPAFTAFIFGYREGCFEASQVKVLTPEEVQNQIGDVANWHVVTFNGVEYTIYSGPGQVMQTRWVKSQGALPAVSKPTVPKPTG